MSAACRPDEFYHSFLRLSRTFLGPFKEFTRFTFKPNSLIFPSIQANLHRFVVSIVCCLGDSLHILSHCPPFVNTFFQVFSIFFILRKNGFKTHKNAVKTVQNGVCSCLFARMNIVAVPVVRTLAHMLSIPLSLAMIFALCRR